MMNAQDFLKSAADPDAWMSKSITLRQCANMLWDGFVIAVLRNAKSCRKKGQDRAAISWDEAEDYLSVAKMLYGLALETVFKAHILRYKPSEIEFLCARDDATHMTSAEIKRLGVSISKGHDLVTLAEKAGAFRADEQGVFATESDRNGFREILKDLTECIMWRSRYPIPKRSGKDYRPPQTLRPAILGHYIRDILDPALDHFQSKNDP